MKHEYAGIEASSLPEKPIITGVRLEMSPEIAVRLYNVLYNIGGEMPLRLALGNLLREAGLIT